MSASKLGEDFCRSFENFTDSVNVKNLDNSSEIFGPQSLERTDEQESSQQDTSLQIPLQKNRQELPQIPGLDFSSLFSSASEEEQLPEEHIELPEESEESIHIESPEASVSEIYLEEESPSTSSTEEITERTPEPPPSHKSFRPSGKKTPLHLHSSTKSRATVNVTPSERRSTKTKITSRMLDEMYSIEPHKQSSVAKKSVALKTPEVSPSKHSTGRPLRMTSLQSTPTQPSPIRQSVAKTSKSSIKSIIEEDENVFSVNNTDSELPSSIREENDDGAISITELIVDKRKKGTSALASTNVKRATQATIEEPAEQRHLYAAPYAIPETHTPYVVSRSKLVKGVDCPPGKTPVASPVLENNAIRPLSKNRPPLAVRDGKRRSQRLRVEPVRFWLNEKVEYENGRIKDVIRVPADEEPPIKPSHAPKRRQMNGLEFVKGSYLNKIPSSKKRPEDVTVIKDNGKTDKPFVNGLAKDGITVSGILKGHITMVMVEMAKNSKLEDEECKGWEVFTVVMGQVDVYVENDAEKWRKRATVGDTFVFRDCKYSMKAGQNGCLLQAIIP